MKARVAVVGAGYWGKNLIRNFHELRALEYVCDPREDALREIQSKYPVCVTADIEPILGDPAVRGIVIATPAAQHFELARRCLLRARTFLWRSRLHCMRAKARNWSG